MNKIITRTTWACLLALPATAWSGEYNNRLLATGERAAGLGGAFVAVADDDTAMLYNPAGLVRAPSDAPSATVNLVSGTSTTYDDVFGSTSWTRDSLGIVPSFFGASKDLGDWSFGGSLVVLDFFSENQTDQFRDVQIGSTTYDELRVHNDSTGKVYNAGLTFARGWEGTGWSLGLTTYFHYTQRNRSFSQRLSQDADTATVQDDATVQVQVQQDDESMGIRPVLGVLYRNDRYAWGLSVAQLFPLYRDYFYAFAGTITTPGDSLAFDLIDNSDNYEDQALSISLGWASFLSKQTTLTLQVDHTTARDVDQDDVPAGLPPRDVDMKAVTNFSGGIESALSKHWVLRAGVYTDLANNDAEDAVLFERREEIDVYGLAFSLSRRRDAGYWTLGFDLSYGDGEATLGDVGFGATDALQRVDATKYAYNLLLSTTW